MTNSVCKKSCVRFAHLSDPHLARSLQFSQWGVKRISGRLNWLCNRQFKHQAERLSRAVDELLRDPPDLVLLTGDLAQTGLPQEFDEARERLAPLAENAKPIPVLIVNGNHDCYGDDTAAPFSALRETLRQHLTPDHTGRIICGALAIDLFDQAHPNPLFSAGGTVDGKALRARQAEISNSAIPDDATVHIACGHYPLVNPAGALYSSVRGLTQANVLRDFLHAQKTQAYFCGHIHTPFRYAITDRLMQYCAGSITAGGELAYYTAEAGRLTRERV